MKEFSIEEKAKRYDEIIKKANKMHSENYEACQICIEELIPELKENEDERIRKNLIVYLRSILSNKKYGDKFIEGWIAWLEKQGEPVEINPTEFDTRLQALIGKFDSLPKEELIGSLSFWMNVIQNDGTYKSDEKQGEQKPADKIEPKFHEGDFILDGDVADDGKPEIFRVLKVCDTWYDVENIYDNRHTIITFKQECSCRVWNTIQDAKDGDVLHSTGFHSDCVFIFNGLDNWKFDEPNGDRAVATGYCGLFVSADNMEFGIQGPDCVEVNTVKPATKIQRDLLFQKMKEAGYEWNDENKELKKIEQKPDLVAIIKDYFVNTPKEQQKKDWAELKHLNDVGFGIEIPFGTKDSELQEWSCSIPEGFHAEVKDNEVFIKKGEQNPVWSEEDEKIYQSIMDDTVQENQLNDKQTNWLRDIKYRYFPQPKQEWSEEDKAMINNLYQVIDDHIVISGDTRRMFCSWLKSLKARYTWKPSDEQLDALETAVSERQSTALESLYEDIRKLKE